MAKEQGWGQELPEGTCGSGVTIYDLVTPTSLNPSRGAASPQGHWTASVHLALAKPSSPLQDILVLSHVRKNTPEQLPPLPCRFPPMGPARHNAYLLLLLPLQRPSLNWTYPSGCHFFPLLFPEEIPLRSYLCLGSLAPQLLVSLELTSVSVTFA